MNPLRINNAGCSFISGSTVKGLTIHINSMCIAMFPETLQHDIQGYNMPTSRALEHSTPTLILRVDFVAIIVLFILTACTGIPS